MGGPSLLMGVCSSDDAKPEGGLADHDAVPPVKERVPFALIRVDRANIATQEAATRIKNDLFHMASHCTRLDDNGVPWRTIEAMKTVMQKHGLQCIASEDEDAVTGSKFRAHFVGQTTTPVCEQYMEQLQPADLVKFQTGNLTNNKPSMFVFGDFTVDTRTRKAQWNLYAAESVLLDEFEQYLRARVNFGSAPKGLN